MDPYYKYENQTRGHTRNNLASTATHKVPQIETHMGYTFNNASD